jgi:hypothetical protein
MTVSPDGTAKPLVAPVTVSGSIASTQAHNLNREHGIEQGKNRDVA